MKRPPDIPGQGSRHGGLHDRLNQSQAAGRHKFEKFEKAQAAKKADAEARAAADAARSRYDIAAFDGALAKIPFYDETDAKIALHVNASYRRIVSLTASAINDRRNQVILCWPGADPSPAAVAGLIAMADVASAAPKQYGEFASFAPPLGLRALIYPYAVTAHRALRQLYIDKDYLGKLHTKHQLRAIRGGDDPALEDFHKTVARVGNLGVKAHQILHPSMDDILPSGPCAGSTLRGTLLGRISKKTDVREISRTRVADDPARAKFYLFGLEHGEHALGNLDKVIAGIDVILLDLDYTGRHRFGFEWVDPLKALVEHVRAREVPTPIVAMTDDPYAYDELRFAVLGTGKGRKRSREPSASAAMLTMDSAIVAAAEKPPPSFEAVESWEVLGFSGHLGPLLERIRAAARASRNVGDNTTSRHLRTLGAILRRCAALPGSVAQFADFIGDDATAADILEAYRIAQTLTVLRDPKGIYHQRAPAKLDEICKLAGEAWSSSAAAGALAPMLYDAVRRYKGASSKTTILFPKDMIADFARDLMCAMPDFGDKFADRVERGIIQFVDRAGFDDIAAQPSPQRNHHKTLIVVAPSRASLLGLLAQPWLPDHVFLLSDADTLAGAAREAARLVKYPDFSALAPRLGDFATAAGAEARRVAAAQVDLSPEFDAEDEENDELEFPLSGMVDLAGNVRAGQTVIELDFEGGQSLRAKPNTKLIVFDRSRAVPVFVSVDAHSVEKGDRVCVISDAFLEMARPLLDISVKAAEEIRDYHEQVKARFAKFEGATRKARLERLVEMMGLADVSVERAAYWVDLDEQIAAPLQDVVPHAPQDQETFDVFAKALGMSEIAAQEYWRWAVIAQRRSRLRAAMAFHDAYRGILVDAYAAQSENPARAADVRRLRTAAENHVSIVRAKREYRGDHVAT